MTKQFRSYLLVTALLFSATSAHSANQCVNLFKKMSFVEQVKSAGAPVFENTIGGKKIPSILMNLKSYNAIQPKLEKTLGIVVAHQGTHTNDHGLLSLGDYIIDRDIPGYRNRGETNVTGISWISMFEYTDYAVRYRSTNNRIAVLFELTDAEYDVATAYQKMRRAALIRPRFTFGQDRNPKTANNILNTGGEICFSFSCGSSINSHIAEIENNLSTDLNKLNITLQEYMNSNEVKNLITEAKSVLIDLDINSRDLAPTLSIRLNSSIPMSTMLKLPDQSAELNTILNWTVGLALSKDYSILMKNLDINNSSDFSNYTSPRASAILVIDGVTSEENFLSNNYVSKGAFSTYRHQ